MTLLLQVQKYKTMKIVLLVLVVSIFSFTMSDDKLQIKKRISGFTNFEEKTNNFVNKRSSSKSSAKNKFKKGHKSQYKFNGACNEKEISNFRNSVLDATSRNRTSKSGRYATRFFYEIRYKNITFALLFQIHDSYHGACRTAKSFKRNIAKLAVKYGKYYNESIYGVKMEKFAPIQYYNDYGLLKSLVCTAKYFKNAIFVNHIEADQGQVETRFVRKDDYFKDTGLNARKRGTTWSRTGVTCLIECKKFARAGFELFVTSKLKTFVIEFE